MNFWWVNQGMTYRQERREGIMWAPLLAADGRRGRVHWDSMDKVEPGDIVLHYADQKVQALGVVVAGSVPSRRPDSLPSDMWEQDGRLVRLDYLDSSRPVHRNDIPEEWRLSEPTEGPFQLDGAIKLGYLFPVSAGFYERFATRFGDRFPDPAQVVPSVQAPVEAQGGAADLLRRLIGRPLETASGRPNMILGVQSQHVVVATDRSPQGSRVPVADVQEALDKLIETGSLTIHPDEAGYRSAFIGAVLRTLPGASITGSPPVLTLERVNATAGTEQVDAAGTPDLDDAETLTFQGDLSTATTVEALREQRQLRDVLFGTAEAADCALCGERYPVRFLWAAHIKKRAVCDDNERRDLRNIAMSACVFGCDALFEMGFVTVDESGHVRASTAENEPAVTKRLRELNGGRCSAFTAGSAPYFQWHRENLFRG